MNSISEKFSEIYNRLLQDSPVFIQNGIESFINLFLFTLILFFVFLLLQTAKNLVLKNGKNLIPYGFCLIGLIIVFNIAFTPRPCLPNSGNDIVRIKVRAISENSQSERFLFISEKERVIAALRDYSMTKSLTAAPPLSSSAPGYIVTIKYADGHEQQIIVTSKSTYSLPVPPTGNVLREVRGNLTLMSYLSGLRI